MIDLYQSWAAIAGIAGIALTVLVILYRDIIKQKIFSKLSASQSSSIIKIMIFLIWAISFFVIFSHFHISDKKFQLTVFVVDEKGNVALENEGRINIPLGNRSLNEEIGPNGRSNFSDITSDYYGDSITIGLDVDGWMIDGRNQFIFTGDPIIIKVKKSAELSKLKGMVVSFHNLEPISNARIIINSDTVVYSDSIGFFNVQLNRKHTLKNKNSHYDLVISKTGYKSQNERYYPLSNSTQFRLKKER